MTDEIKSPNNCDCMDYPDLVADIILIKSYKHANLQTLKGYIVCIHTPNTGICIVRPTVCISSWPRPDHTKNACASRCTSLK